MAKLQRFRIARCEDHVAYLSVEMNNIRKELVRQSNEIQSYTEDLNVLQGNHNRLTAAIRRAFEAVDLKFTRAKAAFRFVYGSLFRLEDLLLPKVLLPPRAKVTRLTPFCGPQCAHIIEDDL